MENIKAVITFSIPSANNNVCKQTIRITQDQFDAMVRKEKSSTEDRAKCPKGFDRAVWATASKKQRLNFHMQALAKDLHGELASIEILQD